MDDEKKFPFLMHKRTFFHVPNNAETRKLLGDEFVPITREQADELSKDRQSAGIKIMKAVVAADNLAALEEAKARAAAPTVEDPVFRDADQESAAKEAADIQKPPAWGGRKEK